MLLAACLGLALSVPMKAILSHEDLLANDDIDVFNTMTLKEKLYPNPVKFTEFTMCMRIKLLSFKGFLSFISNIRQYLTRWTLAPKKGENANKFF